MEFEQLELEFAFDEKTREIRNVLVDIYTERCRQIDKWGIQDHPSFPESHNFELAAKTADYYRELCDRVFDAHIGTWQHILLEELHEAFAESDDVLLEKELVQSAAVIAAWIESIRRNRKKSYA